MLQTQSQMTSAIFSPLLPSIVPLCILPGSSMAIGSVTWNHSLSLCYPGSPLASANPEAKSARLQQRSHHAL